MRTFTTAFAPVGVLAALSILFAGVANATTPTAPAPKPPPPPTTPTYICDNIFDVQPGVFGYTNCQAFGGAPTSAYYTDKRSYMLIPRKPAANDDTVANNGKLQKYRCWGGNVDLPTAVAPERCNPAGPAVLPTNAPPPIPFSG
jgi:hypothetical protein